MKKLSASSRKSLLKVGAGTPMSVGRVLPYSLKAVYGINDISREARVRLTVLEFAKTHPVSVTCRRFGISRATYYRWKKRFDPRNLRSLENRSRRPKKIRKPKWSVELIERVRTLREEYPGWGKAKIAVLIRREGFNVSESTVGRIIAYLKRRGVLREPVRKVKSRKTVRKRMYAVRKPKGYEVKKPGGLIQIDTKDVRPEPGTIYKQFSAKDVVSKWAHTDVRTAATASLAREFLRELVSIAPFKIRAIQVDGGSEFCAEFEQACKEMGILLFCLPPRSPKLNGAVERLHRTCEEEFWNCYDGNLVLEELRPALKQWTHRVYNRIRPHQALGYVSPVQYLESLGYFVGVSHVAN